MPSASISSPGSTSPKPRLPATPTPLHCSSHWGEAGGIANRIGTRRLHRRSKNLDRSLPDMKKRIIFAILGLAVLIAVLAAVKAMQIRAMIEQGKKAVPPPETVTTAAVSSETWENALTSVGSLTAVQGVTVAAELA